MNVLFVCTGNAARSVMAAAVGRSVLVGHSIRSAGTLSIEGRPMSRRTRLALAAHGFDDRQHRSHQLDDDDLLWADLVVVFEPSHLAYIRRHHWYAAEKTVALRRLVALLATTPASLSVEEVMKGARLATIEPQPNDETIDPAGGDQAIFDASASEIRHLVDRLGVEFNRRARGCNDPSHGHEPDQDRA